MDNTQIFESYTKQQLEMLTDDGILDNSLWPGFSRKERGLVKRIVKKIGGQVLKFYKCGDGEHSNRVLIAHKGAKIGQDRIAAATQNAADNKVDQQGAMSSAFKDGELKAYANLEDRVGGDDSAHEKPVFDDSQYIDAMVITDINNFAAEHGTEEAVAMFKGIHENAYGKAAGIMLIVPDAIHKLGVVDASLYEVEKHNGAEYDMPYDVYSYKWFPGKSN